MTDRDPQTLARGLTRGDYLRELAGQIAERWAPIDPPGCHWLNSDAGPSYCWRCAREAAWRQLPTFGPAPAEADWWDRDPQEQLIRDRVDGPQSSESDGPEMCSTCGKTLEYCLTDYGLREEISQFADHPPTPDTMDAETSYALDRAFMDLDWQGADAALREDAITIAESCLGLAVSALLEKEPRP